MMRDRLEAITMLVPALGSAAIFSLPLESMLFVLLFSAGGIPVVANLSRSRIR